MALYELFDHYGDSGMLVGGSISDLTFRKEADEHHRPDERLLTVNNPKELLEHDNLVRAAAGQLATREALNS